MTKYSIGNDVFYPRVTNKTHYITCPDCCGQKFLRVIMGDGTEVTIDCAECGPGYNPPTGFVSRPKYNVLQVEHLPIVGIEKCGDHIEYHLGLSSCSYYRAREGDVFDREEEAAARGEELIKERQAEEDKRLLQKEKPARTWAFNVSYHRGCIRKAEKDLEYHRSKLAVALQHKKAEKHGEPHDADEMVAAEKIAEYSEQKGRA